MCLFLLLPMFPLFSFAETSHRAFGAWEYRKFGIKGHSGPTDRLRNGPGVRNGPYSSVVVLNA